MNNKQMWDAWKAMCATIDFATLEDGIIITTTDGKRFGGPADIATNNAFNHHRRLQTEKGEEND